MKKNRSSAKSEAQSSQALTEKSIDSQATKSGMLAKGQQDDTPLPEADRVEEFFNIGTPKLPIVKTVKYSD